MQHAVAPFGGSRISVVDDCSLSGRIGPYASLVNCPRRDWVLQLNFRGTARDACIDACEPAGLADAERTGCSAAVLQEFTAGSSSRCDCFAPRSSATRRVLGGEAKGFGRQAMQRLRSTAVAQRSGDRCRRARQRAHRRADRAAGADLAREGTGPPVPGGGVGGASPRSLTPPPTSDPRRLHRSWLGATGRLDDAG